MDSSSLLEVMTQDVARRRGSILESARAEAERIRVAARDESEGSRDNALKATEAELAGAARRARERAESEAEMVVLTTKDTVTDEILAAVAEELEGIVEGPGFPAILEALLEELLRDTERGEVVLAPPIHVGHCRRWLAAHGYGHLEVKGMAALRDGVAVQDAQPSFRITNTLSARFAIQEGRLRKLCLERIAPGDAPPDNERPE